jgi:hypothetical protein
VDFAPSQYTVGDLATFATISFNRLGPGLVANFCIADPFFYASQSQQSVPGYWMFDGFDIDAEGEFVQLEVDDKSDSEHAELLGIWNKQEGRFHDQKASRQAELDESLGAPNRLFTCSTPLSSEPPAPDGVDNRAMTETLHSMVMLGWCGKLDKEGTTKTHIMMLNWWKNMPLVLVSPEYLQACSARVYFLKDPLTETPKFATKDCLVGECTFPDNGEDGPDAFVYGDDHDGIEG